jgi:phosphate uptake regulator
MVSFVIFISGKTGFLNTGFEIAIYMTLLKMLLALMVFPARKNIAALAEKVIKKRFRLIFSPLTVPQISESDDEASLRKKLLPVTDTYADYLKDMLAYSYIGIRKPSLRSLFKKVIRYEEVLDNGHSNMVASISRCKNSNTHILWLFMKMSDEAESMGDHAKEIAKYGVRLDEIKHKLSDRQKALLLDCYLMVFKQFHEICIKKNYRLELVAKCEEIERHLRREKRLIYSLLCKEQDHDYEKRLILIDILSEYSKFNHSVKRILQVNLDVIEGRGIFLWEHRCEKV